MFVDGAKLYSIDFDGLKIVDYTATLNTNSSLAVVSVAPGGAHKRAYSKLSDKYYFILSGEIDFSIGSEERRVRDRDVAIVPKGIEFAYSNRSHQAASMILVHTPKFELAAEVFVD